MIVSCRNIIFVSVQALYCQSSAVAFSASSFYGRHSVGCHKPRLNLRASNTVRSCYCQHGNSPLKSTGSNDPKHALGRTSEPIKLFFFSDTFFKPLRDQFVESAAKVGGFDLQETFVENLGAEADRAAGGYSIYTFKLNLLLDALESAGRDEIIVVSDIDIRFHQEVTPYIEQAMISHEACFQKECGDLGVNIGFVALRPTKPCIEFWRMVLAEVESTEGHDQRIVNSMLYSGVARELGMSWDRFPSNLWASSQAHDSLPTAESLVLHHANWVQRDTQTWQTTPEKSMAANLQAKLKQLAQVSQLVHSNNDDGLEELRHHLVADGALAKYHAREFGAARRKGPEWKELPKTHPARFAQKTRQVHR